MKRYPKKYYASSLPQNSSSVPGSCLTMASFSVNKPVLQQALDMLLLQVYGSYIAKYRPIHAISLDYDTLAVRVAGELPSHVGYLADIALAKKHIGSLGLLDDHSVSYDFSDHSMRYMIKNIIHQLHMSGVVQQQLVSYFWDFDAGCSVPDQDVCWVPRVRTIHRVRCFIDSKKESILLHIYEPHLLFGIVGVAVDPEDRRYRKLIGKKIIIPIINRIVPIVADSAVVSSQSNGIKPIIPCHDRESLAIAQRHNLSCDVYAVDSYGIFSSHATIYSGKDSREFSANIIQYLQDIHNYDGSESVSVDVPFCQSTSRYLGYFTTWGWLLFPDIFVQGLVDYLSGDALSLHDSAKAQLLDHIQLSQPIIISASHGCVGIAAVQGGSFIFDYIAKKKIKLAPGYRSLLMIVVNLWYDGLLSDRFTIEYCVDIIFSTADFISQYCDFLDTVYKDNALMCKDIVALRDLCASSTDQSVIVDVLMDILDTVDVFVRDGYYYTISSTIFSGHVFCNPLFSSIAATYALRERKLWNGEARLCLHDKYFSDVFVLSSVIDLALGQTMSDWMLISSNNISQGDFTTHCVQPLSYYSADTLRMALMHGSIGDMSGHELTIQKIWNVCRYVYMEVVASGMIHSDVGDNPLDVIQEDVHQLTPFDQWVLYAFVDVCNKLQSTDDGILPLNHRLDLLYRCIVDDFAVKYIEVVKQRKGPLSHWVMLLCVAMICQLLEPLFPAMVLQIRDLFGDMLPKYIAISAIQLPSKNYKIHLLLLIMGALRKMKQALAIKNHEQVDVCIQGSTDIAHFIQDHRSLIDAIVKVHDLQTIALDQDIPADYLQEHVIDIALGLKVHAQEIADIDRLYILLKEKNEYLQHLRALVTVSNNPEKALKIEKLKEEIHDIEYQIMKGKKK